MTVARKQRTDKPASLGLERAMRNYMDAQATFHEAREMDLAMQADVTRAQERAQEASSVAADAARRTIRARSIARAAMRQELRERYRWSSDGVAPLLVEFCRPLTETGETACPFCDAGIVEIPWASSYDIDGMRCRQCVFQIRHMYRLDADSPEELAARLIEELARDALADSRALAEVR